MESARDAAAFKQALLQSEEFLKRSYLRQLSQSAIAPPMVLGTESIRLIKVKSISEARCTELLDKMSPVLWALHHLGTSISYILHVVSAKPTVYLVIKTPAHTDAALKLIERALSGDSAPALIEIADEKETSHLLSHHLFNSHTLSSLSALILNTTLTQPNTSTIFSKLNLLLNEMSHEDFTLFFLADPIQPKKVSNTIYQLESLFTLLDTFKETTFTYNKNLSDSCTNSTNHSDSKTLSHNCAETDTESALNKSECKNFDTLIINCDVTERIDYVINTQTAKCTETHHSNSHSRCVTDSEQTSSTHSINDSETNTKANNTTYSFKGENKTALELLRQTSAVLTKLYAAQHLPQFNLGIYFAAPKDYCVLSATFTYLHLINKDIECPPESYVTTWYKNDAGFDKLLNCLTTLTHPSFIKNRTGETFTPTALIDSYYLAHLICLPVPLLSLSLSSNQ